MEMSPDKFYLYVGLVSIASLTFALAMVFAIRKLNNIKLAVQWRMASVLTFIGVFVYAKLKANMYMLFNIIGYSFFISIPIAVLLWKYKAKLNNNKFKGVAALSIPISMFFWHWLHSKSIVGEYIGGFVLSFVLLFIAFFFTEKEIKDAE
jgi:hypothetical protein